MGVNFVNLTCPLLSKMLLIICLPRYRRHDFCIIGRNFRQLEKSGRAGWRQLTGPGSLLQPGRETVMYTIRIINDASLKNLPPPGTQLLESGKKKYRIALSDCPDSLKSYSTICKIFFLVQRKGIFRTCSRELEMILRYKRQD